MKKILFFIAALVTVSTTAIATNKTVEAEAFSNNFVRGYGNSFIFVEGGIEFAVFPDGQFDFYAQDFGPNINVGFNSRNVNFSFNTGFNYDPYVQYDSFGAVIQIENTPVFYDYFGRVTQVGNIFINYNRYGRINRLGGLNIFWNGNVFLRHSGFINRFNRGYVYRPWHRYYAAPAFNYCIVNTRPYRQFYNPVRHVYYRPYRNNARFVNINGRRGNNFGRRGNSNFNRRYAQAPRNARERSIGRRVQNRNENIIRNRSTRTARATNGNGRRNTTIARAESPRRNTSVTNRRNTNNRVSQRAASTRNNNVTRNSRNRVNTEARTSRRSTNNSRSTVNKRTRSNTNTSARTSRVRQAPKARTSVDTRSRNTVKRNTKSTSVKRKTRASRNSNSKSTRSRSRGRG